MIQVNLITELEKHKNIAYLGDLHDFDIIPLSEDQKSYIQFQFENNKPFAALNLYGQYLFFINFQDNILKNNKETARVRGDKLCSFLNSAKQDSLIVIGAEAEDEIVLSFLEGMILGNYQFLKYFKEPDKKESTVKEVSLIHSQMTEEKLTELKNLCEAVYLCRDLANEPFSGLNALQLSENIETASKKAGFDLKIYHKDAIREMGMGGLLAVNKGSEHPPVLNVMEWKPENPINYKPIILVGKGIVFDSGGYSIKPTKNSMDLMKFDMAGAAAVIGAMYAISANQIPVHLIAVVPATDNAVDAKSYVPGDVIKMHNGLFVEVLNTDAEGRLILADALSYIQKFDPELVIDLATLTGSAAIALGTEASVVMGTADKDCFEHLKNSGKEVYERVVEFPFWDEYKDMLKSTIADIKNIGGREAGAITAGKFLEYFTDYPWIHVDIAGPAMLSKKNAYRTAGGSAYGVRLLYEYIKTFKF